MCKTPDRSKVSFTTLFKQGDNRGKQTRAPEPQAGRTVFKKGENKKRTLKAKAGRGFQRVCRAGGEEQELAGVEWQGEEMKTDGVKQVEMKGPRNRGVKQSPWS